MPMLVLFADALARCSHVSRNHDINFENITNANGADRHNLSHGSVGQCMTRRKHR